MLHPKLRRGMAGRRGTLHRLEAWAAAHRDPGRPLVWLHAPSVGEALMAQAIIARLRERRPEAQFAFTFFSPSAERVRERIGADFSDYLPWDAEPDVRRALAALSPDVVAFVRTEVWPILTREAAARGARTALVNAALTSSSSRLRGPARWLLRPAYARLDAAGAVAPPDAGNLAKLGVRPERIHVTGDARFDQVWERVAALDRAAPVLHTLAAGMPVLVAGSTWPSDERRLLPAWAHARAASPLRLVIAPHEIGARHLRGIERRLDAMGVSYGRLSEIEGRTGAVPHAVIVDRIGILADLYAIARVAYVGGGFHRPGVHSVVEPAAMRVPVFFGPRHGNAGEAMDLAAAGGGFEVLDGDELSDRLQRIASTPARAAQAGANALAWVRGRLGGAAANSELIERLMDRR